MSKRNVTPLLALCGSLLYLLPAMAQIRPPLQPPDGPGGSIYPFAGATAYGPYYAHGLTTKAQYQYYIYEPAQPTPASAPVILFIHGDAAFTPSHYIAWVAHMCKKGYIVVWVRYQTTLTTPAFSTLPNNALVAWTDALYRLQHFWWEHHVTPQKDVNGNVQTIIAGHSFGGWIAAYIASVASSAIPRIPLPLALVMVEPTRGGVLPTIDFTKIAPNTKMATLSASQDTLACSKDAISIMTSAAQVPAANKNFLFFASDSHGTPQQIANHFFPDTDGYKDPTAPATPGTGIDARDYYITWKLSVAAADCVTNGNNCDYFLGNGSVNQLNMGVWSDGTPMNTMQYFADPTLSPPIAGCP